MALSKLTPEQLASTMAKLGTTKELRKELRKAWRPVGAIAIKHVRPKMRGGSDKQLAAVAGKVRAGTSTAGARLTVPTGRPAAAVWGTKGPTGWLARQKGTELRNNPVWIGNSWTVATTGEGPRGVNDGLAEATDEIIAKVAEVHMEAISKAFPRSTR